MSHKTKRSRQSTIGGATVAVAEPDPMDVDEDMNLSEDEEGGSRIGDIYIPPPVKPYCSNKSVGPRLIITKILNRNFKSYAGEVWLGPFFHRFHAIIGPNGSGKSNVIDSMLFVFGYRANKIRCKKLSVLIHNSAKHNDISSCQVTVHFAQIIDKPDNTYETIEGSEFFISRTAFKDNSSFYTIDDKRVQFKEVAKRLKEHNIDLKHNRFLILQGEVESISTMKPKGQTEGECGHLEYLEDIIGTDRYKEPLLKINNRVEKLTEERSEKHNRCKLAQREMDDLKKPMETAVEYLKLENDLTRTRNLQIQKYLSEQNHRLKIFEEELVEKTNVLKEHDEKYEEIKKQRLEKEATIKEEMAELDRLNKKQESYEQMLKNVFSKYSEIQASMDAINKRRKQAKTQLKKEEENLEHLKQVPEKNASEIKECEKKITKLTEQKGQLEEQLQQNLEELQTQTKPLIEEKEKLNTKLMGLQTAVDECKEALTLSQSELKLCQHNETTEKRKLETLRNAYSDTEETLKEKQNQVKELSTAIPDMKQKVIECEKELQENKKQEKKLVHELGLIRSDIAEKSSSMQAAKSNNKVLNALMKQKFDGNIPGILGRLGDLGGIDSKYDVAISTGCGRLDNIVVDTVDTAQKCLEYLKATDTGRATFIALEKIAHLANQSHKINTPENAPRLYDLIRVEDQRVLPAFYFSLRDTLVAVDLDQGTRISYGAKRFRVVTLMGEVIEMSGTMAGGGRTMLRGRMGTKVQTKTAPTDMNASMSSKNLEKLQVSAQEMQSQINYLQEQQGHLERSIQQLNQQRNQKESQVKKIQIDLKSYLQQLPRIEEQIKQQQEVVNKTESDPEKVRELEETIAEKKKSFDKAEAAAKKVSDQIDTISKKITEINGEKVKSVEKKLSDLTKQIAKLSKNVMKLNVEITTSERDVKKSVGRIENIKNEIKEAEQSIIKGTEDRAQADKDAVELQDRISAIKEDIGKIQPSHMKSEIVALQKEENAGKIQRLEFEQAVQTLNKKISEVNEMMPHWRNKLKPLKLNEIPNETEPLVPLKTYTEEELSSHKLQDLQYKISVQEEKLKSQSPNLNVIDEYFKKREVYLERVQILEDITNKRNEMRQLYDDVRKKRYTEFMQGFTIITRKLKEMYQMITLGGDAELELVDSMDPFSEGVSFSVRPPKKSWKNISNLSGGEKTLSSLALVFALHYYKPSPLYFMDEIDAALDFRNVSIVANYIKARTKNAQFIIISLRSNMFEMADYLTGIYKVKDCTDSLTMVNEDPGDQVKQTQSQQPTQQQSQASVIGDSLMDKIVTSPQRKQSQQELPSSETLLTPPSPSSLVTPIQINSITESDLEMSRRGIERSSSNYYNVSQDGIQSPVQDAQPSAQNTQPSVDGTQSSIPDTQPSVNDTQSSSTDVDMDATTHQSFHSAVDNQELVEVQAQIHSAPRGNIESEEENRQNQMEVETYSDSAIEDD